MGGSDAAVPLRPPVPWAPRSRDPSRGRNLLRCWVCVNCHATLLVSEALDVMASLVLEDDRR